MQSDVVRLGLSRMGAELLLGAVVAAAFVHGRLAGAIALVAAIAGLGAGMRLSLIKARRPQRAAHLLLIGASLAACSLRLETLRHAEPSGASLAPAALLGAAAILDLTRERAVRIKEPLRTNPMSLLAMVAGAALGAVLGGLTLVRLTASVLAVALSLSLLTLSATFAGGPNRPVARPFDAAVLLVAGGVGLLALSF